MNTQLRTHKFTREQILVFDNNVAFANGGSNAAILDASTGVYGIAAGQGGILSKETSTDKMLLATSGITAGTYKRFSIIQGTGVTSVAGLTGHPYQVKPYLESLTVDTRFPIYFTKAYVVNEMYASELVTGFSGTLSKTVHSLKINQSGIRLQQANGYEMRDGFPVSYLTPDYSTLGTSAANAKNDIYTNLGYKANLTSGAVRTIPTQAGHQPFVVFGIGASGAGSTQVTAAGTLNTPQISAVISGATTTLDFMVITRNGVSQKQTFKVTTALREALAKGVADGTLTTTDRIRVIEKASALAGTGAITQLLFVALDSATAVFTDRMTEVKTDIFVTAQPLADLTPTITRVSNSYEGQGRGNQWLLKWKNEVKGNVNTLQQYGFTYSFVEMPDYVKASTNYNVFVLLHGTEQDDFSPNTEHYYATYMLLPNMIPLTIGTPGTGNSAYAQVNSEGVITSVYFTTGGSGGSGTVTVPAIYGGSGAVLAPTYSGGGLTALAITSGGTGYSNIAPIGSTATKSLHLPATSLNTLLGWLTTEDGTTITVA